VVPFPAGGPADALGRIVAEQIRISLGQSVLIENVTGAAGSIGVGRGARATPDGYTLVLGLWSTHVANGAIYTLAYDRLKDFEPVAQIGREPAVIVARKTMPAANLAELIAWLRSNPDKASQERVAWAACRTSPASSFSTSPIPDISSCTIGVRPRPCRI
jgi:tripartite-type tricarboxylate transporter receptor subunit TctC